jgi:hypothetical protein
VPTARRGRVCSSRRAATSFELSKILGHSSVATTQEVYAHLHSDAFAEDYSRVAFAMP